MGVASDEMAMTCREFREVHPAETPEGRSHAAGCADCRAFAEAWRLLGEYPPIEPSAGFLQALRRRLSPPVLRFAAAISAAAAALLLAVVLTHTPVPAPRAEATDEERELVENLDLLQNYELLRTLEFVGENGSPILEEKR
jgi:hypothetical protein